ncbi:ABC transporter ATP-binding protein [Psychromarinibacter sp. C21-152]|uniref:ABC transporter ATP-binding protein n=1 Tax=Psychromarinibacter sediminicola TaxID=3033385 RepID=A0AAE3NVV0_9RHOB|nr:ABC transporter ATP-binding protein [Psychromarinibacter sediminicola]MDF0603056.1 ABC transporter ATP-binding protein [Psychromarinibacter sediminicola]
MKMTDPETTMPAATASQEVMRAEGLSVALPIDGRMVPVVTDVSFGVSRGEAVALVGESGCGKSMTASAIIGLPPRGAQVTGRLIVNGREVLGLSPRQRRKLCGNEIGFIFQEPMTALHPTLRIGRQMTDTICHNLGLSRRAATERAVEILDTVGIPRPRAILQGYVHQLSGGMRQRVMIALALSCEPSLVIADEPTTALDVTIQAQVLDLMERMRKEFDLGMLFITHDLEVVRDFCDRAVVMYSGDVVERGSAAGVTRAPAHPYTRGLIEAVPGETTDRLVPIPGSVPQIGAWPEGCRFAPRCARADAKCRTHPPLDAENPTAVRCWHPLEEIA